MDAPKVTIAAWFGDVGPTVFYAAFTISMAVLVKVLLKRFNRRMDSTTVLFINCCNCLITFFLKIISIKLTETL